MSNDPTTQIVPLEDIVTSRRVIADAIRDGAYTRLIAYADGLKETTNVDFLAETLWNAAVNGQVHFADGKIIHLVEEPKLWMELVKFLAGHIDGGVTVNSNNNTKNVFKIYMGIDPDKV